MKKLLFISLFIVQSCELTASDRLFDSLDELDKNFKEEIKPLDPSKLPAIEEWDTFLNDQNEDADKEPNADFSLFDDPFSLGNQVDFNNQADYDATTTKEVDVRPSPTAFSPIVLSDFEEEPHYYADQKVKRKKISEHNFEHNNDEDESEEEETLEQDIISNDTDSAIKKYYTFVGNNRYQCNHPECSYKKTVILSKAKEHNRKHTGEKPFTCKKCGTRFAQKCNLTSHEKTCTLIDQTSDNNVEYACKTCNKNCNTMTNVIQHLKKNHPESAQLKDLQSKYKNLPDGQRECALCKRILSSNINSHYKVVHTPSKKRPFVCDLCPSFFDKDHILKSHILKCHSANTTE